jgi:hypothetical protein
MIAKRDGMLHRDDELHGGNPQHDHQSSLMLIAVLGMLAGTIAIDVACIAAVIAWLIGG